MKRQRTSSGEPSGFDKQDPRLPSDIAGSPYMRSEDLIGKDRELTIEHNGSYYRLRVTR